HDQSQTIALPPGCTAHAHLVVKTDVNAQVFENGRTQNNTAGLGGFFDVMPAAYSDLAVSSVTVPAGQGYSGQPLEVHWTVKNQGIGLTSNGSWADQVVLSRDAA